MNETDPHDLGDYCFKRECDIKAPLAADIEIAFVGHSPPPARQWESEAHGGRNSTVAALESFLRQPVFAERAAAMGIQLQRPPSTVKLHVVNAIPLISSSSLSVGSSITKRNLAHYDADIDAIAHNDRIISDLVSDRRIALIVLGCGKPKQSQSPFLRRTVHILRRLAEDRTILFCSIGHGLPAAKHHRKYAGHPRPGHYRGVAAQPLDQFGRYPLPI